MKTKQKPRSRQRLCCMDSEELISYLEGSASKVLEKHLKKCKPCQKLVKGAEIRTKVM